MPWPSEKSPTVRLKKARRSRKWLIWSSLGGDDGGGERRCRPVPLDVVEQAAAARVEAPRDQQAADVEGEEPPQRGLDPAGERDRAAVALGDEEGAVGGDRRGETDDRRGFHVRLLRPRGRAHARLEPRHLLAHDRGAHL